MSDSTIPSYWLQVPEPQDLVKRYGTALDVPAFGGRLEVSHRRFRSRDGGAVVLAQERPREVDAEEVGFGIAGGGDVFSGLRRGLSVGEDKIHDALVVGTQHRPVPVPDGEDFAGDGPASVAGDLLRSPVESLPEQDCEDGRADDVAPRA